MALKEDLSKCIKTRNMACPIVVYKMPYTVLREIAEKWLKPNGNIVGFYIISNDFRINFRTIFTISLCIFADIVGITTILTYELFMALRAIPIVGIGIQCLMKTYSLWRERERIKWMWDFTEEIYRKNSQTKSIEHEKIMKKWIDIGGFVTKALFIVYRINGIVVVAYPFILYLFTGHLIPTLPLFIPKVDTNTNVGYIITYIFHWNVGIMGASGLAMCDAYYALFVTNIFVMAKLIKYEVECFNKKLHQSEDVLDHLRNLYLMHKEMST